MSTTPHIAKTISDGREVAHIYHEPVFNFDSERVTGFKVIAFNDFRRVLGVKKWRWYDIMDGHIEWDDESFDWAARREAFEQAGVEMEHTNLSTVIETLGLDGEPSTFTLVMTAFIKSMEPRQGREHKRKYFDKEDFLARYAWSKPEDMRVLLDMAEFYCVKKGGRRKKTTINNII